MPSARGAAGERRQETNRIVPQPKLHWSAYLWPGLPQLWTRGSWAGLTLAVGFTALVNALAATTFVWNEWLPVRIRWIALGAAGVIWFLAWLEGRADWRRLLSELSAGENAAVSPDQRNDALFREAQAAYLAHDWVSAEQTLLKLLKYDHRDAEARLMLATLLRHEQRTDAAAEHLDRLELLETAAAWRHEIAQERERLRPACVVAEDKIYELPTQEESTDTNADESDGKIAA